MSNILCQFQKVQKQDSVEKLGKKNGLMLENTNIVNRANNRRLCVKKPMWYNGVGNCYDNTVFKWIVTEYSLDPNSPGLDLVFDNNRRSTVLSGLKKIPLHQQPDEYNTIHYYEQEDDINPEVLHLRVFLCFGFINEFLLLQTFMSILKSINFVRNLIGQNDKKKPLFFKNFLRLIFILEELRVLIREQYLAFISIYL